MRQRTHSPAAPGGDTELTDFERDALALVVATSGSVKVW